MFANVKINHGNMLAHKDQRTKICNGINSLKDE